ncbi:TetR/AcrR family transcriptional regulator C-terminal domain-containing protein [Streptomyces sp. NPDC096176]|uniref:TetR/AcrR family transcriptional regulator C-terminal domain-containing protein n=1 Tax=Streptomyces sp. NPDC096176 TaxID=3366079 RepID=UPI0037FFE952
MDNRASALQKLAESGRLPTFAKVVGSFADGYDLRLDALFEFGLTSLLDGLTSIIEGR